MSLDRVNGSGEVVYRLAIRGEHHVTRAFLAPNLEDLVDARLVASVATYAVQDQDTFDAFVSFVRFAVTRMAEREGAKVTKFEESEVPESEQRKDNP